MATERIDARDVLDTNAKTAVGFRARIVGRFRRAGPNAWDDYLFEPLSGGELLDVLADVPIQVEAEEAAFRMRRRGEVERLVWEPGEGTTGGTTGGTKRGSDLRARFLAQCIRPFSDDQGIGAAAVIASKLRSTPPKPSLD
jgi:hypothetical protein